MTAMRRQPKIGRLLVAAALLASTGPAANAQTRPISELAAAYDKLCAPGGASASSATCEALKADIQTALGQTAGGTSAMQGAPRSAAPAAPVGSVPAAVTASAPSLASALPMAAASSSGTWFCGAYSQDYARYHASAAFDGGSLDRNAIVQQWMAHLAQLAGVGEPQSVFCLSASGMATAEAGRHKAAQALTADGAELIDSGWTPAADRDDPPASDAPTVAAAPVENQPAAPDAPAPTPRPEDKAYISPINTADAQAAAGDKQGAIATLRAHLATVPGDAAAHAQLARYLRDTGDEDGALAAIGRAIDAEPRNPDARNFRINILMKRKAFAEAFYDLDVLVADGDATTVTYVNRGVVNQSLQAPAEAVADYDRAIAADPANAIAHINKASALIQLRQDRQAIVAATTGLAHDASSTDGYMVRGMAYLNLFDGAAAVQDFSRVLELRPDRSAALRYRAQAYKAAKLLPQAIQDYDALVALAPRDAEFLIQRGICHQEQGDLARAIADYDSALAIEPGNASIGSRRALAQAELAKRGGMSGGSN